MPAGFIYGKVYESDRQKSPEYFLSLPLSALWINVKTRFVTYFVPEFTMAKNRYYENLSFSGGKRINVSERIDANFLDMSHWHSYAEILVSMCDGNQVTVNFVPYTLKTNDIIFIYSGSGIRAVFSCAALL